jgi:phosphoribosylamine--glycine ligase
VQVKVLVLGGGGREHALAWKLSQSPLCDTLYCAPGNPGIIEESNVSGAPELNVSDHEAVVSFCQDNSIGLVVVGPELPLVEGLTDSLKSANLCTFGPSKKAAQLEGSKVFMKVCMTLHSGRLLASSLGLQDARGRCTNVLRR